MHPRWNQIVHSYALSYESSSYSMAEKSTLMGKFLHQDSMIIKRPSIYFSSTSMCIDNSIVDLVARAGACLSSCFGCGSCCNYPTS